MKAANAKKAAEIAKKEADIRAKVAAKEAKAALTVSSLLLSRTRIIYQQTFAGDKKRRETRKGGREKSFRDCEKDDGRREKKVNVQGEFHFWDSLAPHSFS